MIRAHKYADGGKIVDKRPRKARKPAGGVADTMLNTRARQMKALGLRDGGRVKLPSAETRKVPPSQLPAPQSGSKPKRIGKR